MLALCACLFLPGPSAALHGVEWPELLGAR